MGGETALLSLQVHFIKNEVDEETNGRETAYIFSLQGYSHYKSTLLKAEPLKK